MKTLLAVVLLCLIAVPARSETKEPPVPVRTVPPEYPFELRRSGQSGVVTVRCTINERGEVVETVVVKSSDPAFEKPAVSALQRWKFKPATLDGKPVTTKALIPLHFVIGS
jgi:periplasmic protein TonB